jgi:hypothetical protein
MADIDNCIWVLHGDGSRFASAVFDSSEMAAAWIEQHQLTGLLTAYPLNEGVYDWATRGNVFAPKNPARASPDFVQRFTSASQPHFHFERGRRK